MFFLHSGLSSIIMHASRAHMLCTRCPPGVSAVSTCQTMFCRNRGEAPTIEFAEYFGAYLAHVNVLYIKMFAASRPLTVTCTQLQVCTCCACKRAQGGSFYLADMHRQTQLEIELRNESEKRGVGRCLIVSFQHYPCLLHDNLLKQ